MWFNNSGIVCIFRKKKYIYMSSVIETYKLGSISVEITEAERPKKLNVSCNDGDYKSKFTISEYEYNNYKRHMNQRIKNAYDDQHEEE